jgi:hypothetical protein
MPNMQSLPQKYSKKPHLDCSAKQLEKRKAKFPPVVPLSLQQDVHVHGL